MHKRLKYIDIVVNRLKSTFLRDFQVVKNRRQTQCTASTAKRKWNTVHIRFEFPYAQSVNINCRKSQHYLFPAKWRHVIILIYIRSSLYNIIIWCEYIVVRVGKWKNIVWIHFDLSNALTKSPGDTYLWWNGKCIILPCVLRVHSSMIKISFIIFKHDL